MGDRNHRIVYLNVLEAINLHSHNGGSSPDPLVKISCINANSKEKELFQTLYLSKSANPQWLCDGLLYLNPTETSLKFSVYSHNSVLKDKKLGSATFDLVNDTKDSTGGEHTLTLSSGYGTLKIWVRVFKASKPEMGDLPLPRVALSSELRLNVNSDHIIPGETIKGTLALYTKEPMLVRNLALRLETLVIPFHGMDEPVGEDWKLLREAGEDVLDHGHVYPGLSVWAFEFTLPVIDSTPTFEWRSAATKTQLMASYRCDGKTTRAIKSIHVEAIASDLNGHTLEVWKRDCALYPVDSPTKAPFESRLHKAFSSNRSSRLVQAFASRPLDGSAVGLGSSHSVPSVQPAESTLWIVPPPSLPTPVIIPSEQPPAPESLQGVTITWLENFRISPLYDDYSTFIMSNYRLKFTNENTRREWADKIYLVQEICVNVDRPTAADLDAVEEVVHRFKFEMNAAPQSVSEESTRDAPSISMRPKTLPKATPVSPKTTVDATKLAGPKPFLLNLQPYHLPGIMSAQTYVELAVFNPSTQEEFVVTRKPFYYFGLQYLGYRRDFRSLNMDEKENEFRVAQLMKTEISTRAKPLIELSKIGAMLAPSKGDTSNPEITSAMGLFLSTPTINVDDSNTPTKLTTVISDYMSDQDSQDLCLVSVMRHDETTPSYYSRLNGQFQEAHVRKTVVAPEIVFKPAN